MQDCIFCKIIKGEIDCYKIYEDKDFLGFLDIFPKTEGHVLIVPKVHVEWVWDYPELGKYFETVGKVAKHLKKVSGKASVRGYIYGFDVPHAHVHLMPGKSDKFKREKLPDDKMRKMADKFRV